MVMVMVMVVAGGGCGGGDSGGSYLRECKSEVIYTCTLPPVRDGGLFVPALSHQHVSWCAQHYSEHATFDTVMPSARDTQVCRHSTWCRQALCAFGLRL